MCVCLCARVDGFERARSGRGVYVVRQTEEVGER